MGIGVQELQFLIKVAENGAFKDTITIARQGVHIFNHQGQYFLNDPEFNLTPWSEDLLIKYFGSTKVDSVDYSDYEGATFTHDLNLPITDIGEYDTVFDSGTLEHVFNINTAFKNLSKLCKVGGQILHCLPANNNCGHGFWQFSPELFFALYSEKNGYKDTQVYIGDTTNNQWFFEMDPPGPGQRHDIQHPNPVYVMVRTVLATKDFSHNNIQQGDYAYQWVKAGNE